MPCTPAPRDAEAQARQRHEVDIERRRAHPGEPRRVVVADKPAPGHDRRGAHGVADPSRYR
jgi:hypothetical protein